VGYAGWGIDRAGSAHHTAHLSHQVGSAGQQHDVAGGLSALSALSGHYLGTTMHLVLIGALVAMIRLISWGESQGAR
jgi:hypothetical protein